MNKFKYILLILCLFVTTNVYAIEDNSTKPTTSQTTTSYVDYDDDYGYTYGYGSSKSDDIVIEKSSTIIIKEVENYSNKIFIDDKEDLLNEEQEELLFEDMSKLVEVGNIGFLSISNSTSSEEQLATKYYVANFGETNGILFMINMSTRQLTLRAFSDKANVDLIKSNKVDSILANVYRYAHDGDYYRTAKVAFNQAYTVITGKAIFEPMKIASNAILAFVISSFILYIYVLSSSSIKRASNKELLSGIKKTASISNINIVKNGIRRVYSPQSSSSSGGGSSGGGGGGGFHSSGGSHGF